MTQQSSLCGLFSNSQGRDGLIKVLNAEKLSGGGQEGAYQGASGTTPSSSTPSIPVPLREVATGAFHFCQFALTRWRSSTVMSPAAKDPYEISRPNSEREEVDDSGGNHNAHSLDGGLRGEAVQAGLSIDGLSRRRGNGGGDAVGSAPLQKQEGLHSGHEHCSACTGPFAENMLLAPCGETHAV